MLLEGVDHSLNNLNGPKRIKAEPMKELVLRRKLENESRVELENVQDGQELSLTMSRFCFENDSVREKIVHLLQRIQCKQLIIISCRELRVLFEAVGQLDLPRPVHIGHLKLVNPSQDGIASICTELARGTIHVDCLGLSTSLSAYAPVCLSRALEYGHIPSLDLSGCFWDDAAVTVLADAFSQSPTLQSLNLSSGHLDDAGLTRILTSLQGHRTLEELDISGNSCRQPASQAIAQVIQNTNLKKLTMSNLFVGGQTGFDMETLAKALSTNSSLSCLSLENNYLQESKVAKLLESLTNNNNTGLRELNLEGTFMSCNILPVLVKTLVQNRTLRRLSLKRNHIEDVKPLLECFERQEDSKCSRCLVEVDINTRNRTELYYSTYMNRAGKKYLVPNSVPVSHWPMILELASQTQLEEDCDDITVHDILFGLLRGPAILER